MELKGDDPTEFVAVEKSVTILIKFLEGWGLHLVVLLITFSLLVRDLVHNMLGRRLLADLRELLAAERLILISVSHGEHLHRHLVRNAHLLGKGGRFGDGYDTVTVDVDVIKGGLAFELGDAVGDSLPAGVHPV